MKKWLIVMVVLALLSSAAAVLAQQGPYIQINNGTIVTNFGQRPQVVIQFGNRSQQMVEDAIVVCFFSRDLGLIDGFQAGPFEIVDVDNSGDPGLFYGYELDEDFNALSIPLDIPPGQNWNVSFNIYVDRRPPNEIPVTCFLSRDDFSEIYDMTEAMVRVQ